jgi:hypothetical protein
VRKRNYTQIFTAGIEVSGSLQSSRKVGGVADEVDYQKQERLRELLRDLENCVINGVASSVNPQGATGVRRTMQGIIPAITTNAFVPGANGFPAGGGGGNGLTEVLINSALRLIWEHASSRVDTIVCSGAQKRKINEFLASARLFTPQDLNYINRVAAYESDFGICRIVLSRWVPADTVLLLDSSRLSVMPLSGRSFQFKPLASTGDSTVGMVLGEYTLEMLNENAHGLIRGLSVT